MINPDSSMSTRNLKIDQFDSLRGLAALIVFLGHFTLAFIPQRHGYISGGIVGGNLMETPFFFLINGSASVTLFFALSGFVLSYKFFQNPEASVSSAFIRRWPRLFPIAVASTVLSFALYKFNLFFFSEASALTHSDWMRGFGFSSTYFSPDVSLIDALLQGGFLTFFRGSGDSWMNSSLWTMHLEFVGSLVVYGLISIIRGASSKQVYLVFLVFFVVVFFVDIYLLLFLAGSLLAYIHTKYNFSIVCMKRYQTILYIAVMFLCFSYMDPGKGIYSFVSDLFPNEFYFRVFVHGLTSLVAIHMVFRDQNFRSVLSWRIFRFFGRISFPLYAIHVPLLFSLSAGCFLTLFEVAGYKTAVVVTFFVTLTALLLLSYVLSIFDSHWCSFVKRNI